MSFTLAVRRALVECWRTAGTTSSFRYLMNSGISFSIRSAASATVLLTRAEASSTLRLKSSMMLLAMLGRESGSPECCGCQAELLFRACEGRVNGGLECGRATLQPTALRG